MKPLKTIQYYFCISSMLLFVVPMLSCTDSSLGAGPKKNDISSYLLTKISASYGINDIRCENYIGSEEHSGRTSCVGDFVLLTDLVQNANKSFYKDANTAGIVEVDRYRNIFSKNKFHKIVFKAGELRPFKAELIFNKQIDGWSFLGTPKYIPLKGTPVSDLKKNGIIINTPEYKSLIDQLIRAQKQKSKARLHFIGMIEKFFSQKAPINVRYGQGKNLKGPVLRINMTDDLNWSYDKEHMGPNRRSVRFSHEFQRFVVDGKATVIQKGYYGDYEPNQKILIRFDGAITHNYNWDSGWKSVVRLLKKDNNSKEYKKFAYLSSQWNGKAFVTSAFGWEFSRFVESSNDKEKELPKQNKMYQNLISGDWAGNYRCSQGETGLSLNVSPASNEIQATFNFYPTKDNPKLKKGSFLMAGAIDSNGNLYLDPKEWIKRPDDYIMLPLAGHINESGKYLTGSISSKGCTVFELHKK